LAALLPHSTTIATTPPAAVEHRVDHSRAPLLPRCWLPEMPLQRDEPCGAVRARISMQSIETECVARTIRRTDIDLICYRDEKKNKKVYRT